MRIDYNLLYNGAEKARFIEKYEGEENRSKLTIYGQFLRIAEHEEQLGKDIYNMTTSEITDLLLECNFSSFSSATAHISTYKRYAEENNTTSPFNGFVSLVELAESVVAKDRDRRYSKNEIDDVIDSLTNDTDKALLLALFEGVKGQEFSEVCNLKVDDIEDDTLLLTDTIKEEQRKIKISEQLKNLLIKANKQYEYESAETMTTSEFCDSEYVFKKVKKGKMKDDSRVDFGFINRKMLMFKKVFDNDYLKVDNIVQSGMMYMAYKIFMETGDITREDICKIGAQYGISKIKLTGGEIGFNITNLKRKIFHRSIQDIYPELAVCI